MGKVTNTLSDIIKYKAIETKTAKRGYTEITFKALRIEKNK